MDRGGSHDSESLFGISLAQILSDFAENGGVTPGDTQKTLVSKPQRSNGAFWIP